MCDYSLQNVASRAAKVGDQLVTTKFPNNLTRGFATIEERDVALCLLPGTEISFETEVAYRNPITRLFCGFRAEREQGHSLARLFTGLRVTTSKVACFRQIDLDNPLAHHDALEFPDGTIVLVTSLCPGQRATVLQMPIDRQRATIRDVPQHLVSVA